MDNNNLSTITQQQANEAIAYESLYYINKHSILYFPETFGVGSICFRLLRPKKQWVTETCIAGFIATAEVIIINRGT